MQPWQVVAQVATEAGPLELRRRGTREFLITIAGRILMTSRAHRSEEALADAALAALPPVAAPAVLVGGLGMGYTLRAALDRLPPHGRVVVAELTPAVVEWCRGPLAELTAHAVGDPRVTVRVEDVGATVERAAQGATADRFHAILLDLYEGPRPGPGEANHPLYGTRAIERFRAALHPGGVLAVWSEDPAPPFARRLTAAGFRVRHTRTGRGGRRHVVYVGESVSR